MRFWILFGVLWSSALAVAQWQILDTHSTADFRGVANVGKGVVWISGTNGTVLRSEDGGYLWQHCTTPPGAETLDFRGIQAFDANTAIVMSSGKGDLSRLYKTTDGCQTWKLIRTNKDADGFWDALVFAKVKYPLNDWDAGELVGDPVNGHFVVFSKLGPDWSEECGCDNPLSPRAHKGETLFAASNSSVLSFGRGDFMMGTGGVHGSRVIFFHEASESSSPDEMFPVADSVNVPLATGSESSGIFALGERDRLHIVAVGGDYAKPDDIAGVAAWTSNGGKTWHASSRMPHGFRSAVACDEAAKTWITLGPNGTDVSTDDGRNWRALRPIAGDAVGSDRDWNALSLPYVVGPHGRVGMLEPAALGAK